MKQGSCLDKPREAIIGETFQRHVAMYVNPHHLEGCVYSYSDDLLMVAQVGYEEFTLVSLVSGNRMIDPVVVEDGLAGILAELLDSLGDTNAFYVGTVDDIVRKSVLKTIGR